MDRTPSKSIIPTISAIIKEEKIYPPIQLQEKNEGTLLTDQIRIRESWAQLEKDISESNNELNKEQQLNISIPKTREENSVKITDFKLKDRQLLRNNLKEELTGKEKRKSEVYQQETSSPEVVKRKSAPECLYPNMEVTENNEFSSSESQNENDKTTSSESQKVSAVIESTKSDQSYDTEINKCMSETLPIDELVREQGKSEVKLRENKGVLYRSVSEIIQDDIAKSIHEAPKFGIRHWQILLYSFVAFLGLGFRVTLSVAIVAMTDPLVSTNKGIPTYPEWQDQSVVLSAFFWGYIIPQVFAGWMASRYGSKWFLVGSMCLCSIMSLLIPFSAAVLGSLGVMICRAGQGFSQGFFFPCLHHVISQWVPSSERSRLGGFIYAANPIGTVVAMVVSGTISASNLGWPWVFYLYGILGLLWCLISTFFAYNSPKDCALVSFAERAYIENSLGHNDENVPHRTPWKEIATSFPVWAILITMFGQNWGFWTLITEIPFYLNSVMKFNIQKNSILSALPYLVAWILSFGMNYTCDKLIARKMLSVGAARKAFNSLGLIFPAIALVFLGHTPSDNPQRAVILLIVAVGLNAGTYCGYLVNHVDISPNHAGVLMGITNCLSNISGILAPLTVQFVVKEEDNPDQWKIIFFLAAAIYVITNTFFVIFGSGKVQSWNEEDRPRVLGLGIRHLQITLVSFLMFLSYGMRVTPSVAIIAMTSVNTSSNPEVPAYPSWKEKNIILSAFLWGYPVPQVFAGWFVSQYGSKWILIITMCICSTVNLLIPLSADYVGSYGVMVCRMVQGLSQGFVSPALHHILSRWVPPNERSRLGNFAYSGGPLGTVVCMVLSGLISASELGWPWIFYLYGVGGLTWCLLSFIFSASGPEVHPYISDNEKFYIERSLGHFEHHGKYKTPWKRILTSVPVWAIMIAHCGQNLGFYGLLTEIPRFMRHVMRFDILKSSFLSAPPYLLLWVMSFVMSVTSDVLVNKKILKLTTARKLFNSIGLSIPAIALIGLAYAPPDKPILAVVLLVIAVGFNAGVYSGYNLSHVDLSPNHAAQIMGITNCVATIAGMCAPLMVQFIVTNDADRNQWRIIFYIFAGMYIFSGIIYDIYVSGDIQPWNDEGTPTDDEEGDDDSKVLRSKHLHTSMLSLISRQEQL